MPTGSHKAAEVIGITGVRPLVRYLRALTSSIIRKLRG